MLVLMPYYGLDDGYDSSIKGHTGYGRCNWKTWRFRWFMVVLRATGCGDLLTGMQVAERIKLPIEGSKVAVQGFCNVGNEAAICLIRSAKLLLCKITQAQFLNARF